MRTSLDIEIMENRDQLLAFRVWFRIAVHEGKGEGCASTPMENQDIPARDLKSAVFSPVRPPGNLPMVQNVTKAE